MLLIAVAPLPYGYYTLLRLVSFIVFAWASVVSYRDDGSILPYAFGLLVLLYNPFIKVSFDKEVWAIVNLASAIFLIAAKRHVMNRDRS